MYTPYHQKYIVYDHDYMCHHPYTCFIQYLQFDLNTKVNLADLTFAMEQELRGIEHDNATYQAAIMSYQQELRHLK